MRKKSEKNINQSWRKFIITGKNLIFLEEKGTKIFSLTQHYIFYNKGSEHKTYEHIEE
jgi:hypothetical protein